MKSPLKQKRQPYRWGREDLGAALVRTKLFVVLDMERTWKCCSPAVLFPSLKRMEGFWSTLSRGAGGQDPEQQFSCCCSGGK